MRRLFPFLLLTALAACGPPAPEKLTLEPVAFTALPGWNDDAVSAALPALRRSCAVVAKLPEDKPWGPEDAPVAARAWRGPCTALASLPPDDDGAARGFLERWFRPFRAKGNDGADGLFTGYYEPELKGAREEGPDATVPLYGHPTDLVTVDLGQFDDSLKGKHIAGRVDAGKLVPYPTRADIEAGAIRATAPTLLWVEDSIELFFLQVQGSGRVLLPDGSEVRVGYEAANGRSYHAIGKILADRGEMPVEKITLQSLKEWLRAHPDQAKGLMDQNPSYVFFRIVAGEGPVGAEGVPLTPGRSLAVDNRFVPYGTPIWLDIQSPDQTGRLRRLVVAQDRGGAIKGPVRGDLFWGAGADAELNAGRMRSRGSYYLLLPKDEAGK